MRRPCGEHVETTITHRLRASGFHSFLILVLLAFPAGGDKTLPRAEDVTKLAQAAESTAAGFRTQSAKLRFQYEYSGRFLNTADRRRLHQLAKSASERLEEIAQSQRKLKAVIEQYQGDDWDDRYGETGLWRKLFNDLYVTCVKKLQADLYVALCAQGPDKKETLHAMLAQMDALRDSYDTAYLQLARAKALGLLSRTDPTRIAQARKEFDLLAERSDMRHSTAFKIAIERIKLLGPGPEDRLSKLTDELAQSTDVNDLELILSLAILQRRLNRPEAFEKTVRNWPQIENLLGSLTLADLSSRLGDRQFDFRKVTILEAELAAQAAWADGPETHANLLRRLAPNQKLQTPLVFYVTALASARTSPIEAGNLLIKAATLQKQSKSDRLDIEAEKIAEQAAMLLCNSYLTGQADHSMLLGVLMSYRNIAGEPTNEQLDYCYAVALMETGQKEKGAELLRKIAQDPMATRRHRAKLDLIENRVINDYFRHRKNKAEIAADLLDLLQSCTAHDEPYSVRTEAINLYCRLLLDSKNRSEAKAVLNVLTETEIANDPNLNVFKSKALRHLDRLDGSAECLVKICCPEDHEYVREAHSLLVQSISTIEQLQNETSDFSGFLDNALKIAQYCRTMSTSTGSSIPVSHAGLLLAEVSLLKVVEAGGELSQIEEMLDNLPGDYRNNSMDFFRCRARLLAAQGKFDVAAGLWAKVAEIQKGRSASPGQRNWQWWRAKYYELHCCSKIPQTQGKDVVHNIEVLRSSFTDIPALWAERLSLLKQQCLKDDDSTRRL